MAFPTVESVTGTGFASAATSHSVAMPATVSSGDLLLIFIAPNHGNSHTAAATGWTNKGTNDRCFLLAKISDGSEGGTTVSVSVGTSSTAAARVFRISGWYGDLAGVEQSNANSVGNSALADPPSRTASWGSDDNLWIAACGFRNDDYGITTYPTGFSDGAVTVSGGGADNGASIATCWRQEATATKNPDAFTIATDAQASRSYTAVVRPGAGGGSILPFTTQQMMRMRGYGPC